MLEESRHYIATPPGATIKEQIVDRGMTQKEFAIRMGMSEKHISKLINGDVHLTPDVAERLELVLGIPAYFWNKLEAIYQEKLVKVRRDTELEQEESVAKRYPYKDICRWLGHEPSRKKGQEVIDLCRFFEVSRLQVLENQALTPIACRKMGDTEKSHYILLSLAQLAKRQARDMDVAAFSKEKMKKVITEIRRLTAKISLDFKEQLIHVFKGCGVALVFLPEVRGSFLHGITFEGENHKVVLGIGLRGKDADRFWFSLFHEIAHILLGHIYQEKGISEEDEASANAMAADLLIPRESIRKFYNERLFSIEKIKKFADEQGIGAGIVIGRLQHDGMIPFHMYNQYKSKYGV